MQWSQDGERLGTDTGSSSIMFHILFHFVPLYFALLFHSIPSSTWHCCTHIVVASLVSAYLLLVEIWLPTRREKVLFLYNKSRIWVVDGVDFIFLFCAAVWILYQHCIWHILLSLDLRQNYVISLLLQVTWSILFLSL